MLWCLCRFVIAVSKHPLPGFKLIAAHHQDDLTFKQHVLVAGIDPFSNFQVLPIIFEVRLNHFLVKLTVHHLPSSQNISQKPIRTKHACRNGCPILSRSARKSTVSWLCWLILPISSM